ncbi:MAG TPA: hypothetical protein VLS44_08925 [Nitrospira sp.]|nr:hypothetical protein [Nitrospira sp.]
MVQRLFRKSAGYGHVSFRLRSLLAGIMVLSLAGCSWFSQGQSGPVSPPYSLTPALRFHPAMLDAVGTYRNACGASQTIVIGRPLAAAVQQKLGGVFTRMRTDAAPKPDGVLETALVSQRVDLAIPRQAGANYPATVTIGLDLAYLASDGTTLFSKTLERTGHGKVTVHEGSCEVAGLDLIVKEAAELVAGAVVKPLAASREVRQLAAAKQSGEAPAGSSAVIPAAGSVGQGGDPSPQGPSDISASQGDAPSSQASSPAPSVPTDVVPSTLTFRAIMRDESRDQILQPDEPLTIEIEIKNDGPSEVQAVEVLVSGTGVLIAQLPSTIAVGNVQPGEIKRTTITKPVAGVTEPLRGEVLLSLRAGSPLAQVPPVKKFVVLVKPGAAADAQALMDLDQPPKPVAALKQPKAVVLAIGVGHFRDERVSPLKYAGRDAEVMAAYLQAITGVANHRVRVLRDGQALKQDLAEAFEEWLPAQVEANSVVYVFFSGRAQVDGVTGAVSLMPFDGTLSAAGRLYAVRRIQESLSRLSLQRAILMFDVSLESSPGTDPKGSASPVWDAGASDESPRTMWMIGNKGLQEAHAYERARHGLFTYQLLKGLQGQADLDRDGTVVAGELCTYARGEVGRAAREQFGNEQEALCVPPVGQEAMVRMQPMAKGNNPKPASPAKQDSPGSGASPTVPAFGVFPKR